MTKASVQPARGTRDFLPLAVRRRQHVTSVVRAVFEQHGFEPLETPAFERLDALLGKYGDEGDQLLFKLLLRGEPLVEGVRKAAAHIADEANLQKGRSGVTARGAEPLLADLGLRYDLTVPLARVYAAHHAELPPVWKRYQIQPVWRADTPGKGRYRELYQCDIDVVGSRSPLVEAELLNAQCEVMQKLGFADFVVRLNHRGLLRAMIEHAGIEPALETTAIVALDKLDKVGKDGVVGELGERGVPPSASAALLATLEAGDVRRVREQLGGHAAGVQAADEVARVIELCGPGAAGKHVRFDAALARGLGYYTGCIFEIAVPDFAGSLGGGGRYDGLIGMFLGKPVPACGFALGLERVQLLMEERGLFPASLGTLDVLLGAADEARLGDALALAAQLRTGGARVDLQPDAINPAKLRKQAEARGVRAAVWIEAEDRGVARAWTLADHTTRRDLDPSALLALLAAAPEDGDGRR